MGQDIKVDYGEAAKNSAIVATISGAATYVASRQRGTAVEQVEGEGIYEKAHALDRVKDCVTGTQSNSKLLRKNMLSSGQVEPTYKNAAHHIVAVASAKAEEARAILTKYNVEINSAENGVFLPTEKGVSAAAYHPSLHTNVYYRKINTLLRNASSREDVLDILDMIRADLLDGGF